MGEERESFMPDEKITLEILDLVDSSATTSALIVGGGLFAGGMVFYES